MKVRWFLSLLLFSCHCFGFDLSDPNASTIEITSEVDISLQPPERTDFENFEFERNSGSELKLGYTTQALWIRFQLKNASEQRIQQALSFSSALIGDLKLYEADSHKMIAHSGSSVPYVEKSYPAVLSVFPIDLNPGQSKTYLIKRTSVHNLSTKMYLGPLAEFLERQSETKAALSFYLGGILCLMIYNLFVGLYTKDFSYLIYVLFAGALASAALTTQGFFDGYIFKEISFSDSLMVVSSTAILMSLCFVYRFLNIPNTLPKARLGFFILSLSALTTLVMGFLGNFSQKIIFGYVIDLTVALLLVFMAACGIFAYRRGHRLAKFFLLSWVSILIGVFSWLGMTYGILPNSAFTSHALMFGNMGEMLILSLGLAFKINILDREKNEALIQAQEKERYHRLVKVLSHDVANAITIFSNYLTRLRRSESKEATQKIVDRLDVTVTNMKDMLGLVRDEEALNSFRLSVNLKQVDLSEVVHEVVSYYEEMIASKNLKFEIQVPEKSYVCAERTALSNQVLANVISNAVKFSFAHSTVRIFLEELPQHLVLKIQDYGCGLKKEDVQRVFFSKEVISRPGTLKEKGSGLGISLVKDYMAIFRGQLKVDSVHESISKSSGTTISLVFPRIF